MVVLARLRWILEKINGGHQVVCSHTFRTISGKTKFKFVIEQKEQVVPAVHRVLLRQTVSNISEIAASDGVISVDRGHKHSSDASVVCIWIQFGCAKNANEEGHRGSGLSAHGVNNLEEQATKVTTRASEMSGTCNAAGASASSANLGDSCNLLDVGVGNGVLASAVGLFPCGASASCAEPGDSSCQNVHISDPWIGGCDPWCVGNVSPGSGVAHVARDMSKGRGDAVKALARARAVAGKGRGKNRLSSSSADLGGSAAKRQASDSNVQDGKKQKVNATDGLLACLRELQGELHSMQNQHAEMMNKVREEVTKEVQARVTAQLIGSIDDSSATYMFL